RVPPGCPALRARRRPPPRALAGDRAHRHAHGQGGGTSFETGAHGCRRPASRSRRSRARRRTRTGHGGRAARRRRLRAPPDSRGGGRRHPVRSGPAAGGASDGARGEPGWCRPVRAMSVIEAVRRANRPGVPEDSVRLRVACAGAVLVAIAACASLDELAAATALVAGTLVTAGMIFSYRTRARPPALIKAVVAVGAVAACVWFFRSVTAPQADLASVEDPLTLLLASVLVLHSFHVPARRDLLFSLAASAGLIAVGGAQAIDLGFGLYVAGWAGFCFWALTEMWSSASGGGRISVPSLVCALGALSASAAAIFLVLPAPVVSVRVAFLARAGLGGSVGVPGALAGDSGGPAQLAHAGSVSGTTRVGGYLGFAKTLDTALRGQLSDQLVMQVRADRPSYWVGETFDTWLGESWVEPNPGSQPLREGSPLSLPPAVGSSYAGVPDLQTFYVAGSTADLVFHAESASELWFPSSKVFVADDGTIVSPI